MKFKDREWVNIEFPCGFETRGFIAGFGADLIFNRQWIVYLDDRYPGHEFDYVILDESCISKIK